MLIKKGGDLRYSDITPKSVYFNRRQFLAGVPAAFLGLRAANAAKLAAVKSQSSTTEAVAVYCSGSTAVTAPASASTARNTRAAERQRALRTASNCEADMGKIPSR